MPCNTKEVKARGKQKSVVVNTCDNFEVITPWHFGTELMSANFSKACFSSGFLDMPCLSLYYMHLACVRLTVHL